MIPLGKRHNILYKQTALLTVHCRQAAPSVYWFERVFDLVVAHRLAVLYFERCQIHHVATFHSVSQFTLSYPIWLSQNCLYGDPNMERKQAQESLIGAKFLLNDRKFDCSLRICVERCPEDSGSFHSCLQRLASRDVWFFWPCEWHVLLSPATQLKCRFFISHEMGFSECANLNFTEQSFLHRYVSSWPSGT